MHMEENDILDNLCQKHFDTAQYGLGKTRFQAIRWEMGLLGTHQQGHTMQTIGPAMVRLRRIYPKAGAREMISLLFHEEQMQVPRSVVTTYFAIIELDLVRQRKANQLKRKQFWSAGVNDLWAVDQHDKWLQFGLGLHSGCEPFAGKLLWMKVWWGNSNPRLITSYYLEFMPLVTQSDPSSENNGIANSHTYLRHWHDPSLINTLQHRWIFVFRWVFIPWLQRELDAYVDHLNNTRKCADCKKILPHDVPNHIFESPDQYDALDFKVKLDPQAIAHVRDLYAPPDHPTFELVPLTFALMAAQFYSEIGSPIVTRDNVWNVYLDLLGCFRILQDAHDILPKDLSQWQDAFATLRQDPQDFLHQGPDIDLIPHTHELENGMERANSDGMYYMGGVNNGWGLDSLQEAQLDKLGAELEPILGDADVYVDSWSDKEEDEAVNAKW
ncbi:hypothetical protein JAAARDRAFT_62969 [Jaapia argillacea MUCL 33604]|uniref:Uncharacterized protein n=1 Tax=Jaapia argillacea MUCL 33604 TaxID=933084 RepID=A0A067P7E0_9AGAM|nr:hypothetical protein JAAARDRAFT_62969 [Jaapia argillacea MUCL 33604]